MKANPPGWSIVLAGVWNRAIFSPDWVGRVLFKQPEVEALIALTPLMPIVYRNQAASVEVSSTRLAFRPRELNDNCLRAAEGMAIAVLEKLQDTPLSAVGVNFSFIEPSPHATILKLFDLADDSNLSDHDWTVKQRALHRKLERDGDILNFKMTLGEDGLTLDFNFHTETTENEIARASVSDRAVRLRDASLDLLTKSYHLELDLGE